MNRGRYLEDPTVMHPESHHELRSLLTWQKHKKPFPPSFKWAVAVDGSDVSWNAMEVCAGLFKPKYDKMTVFHISKIT
jgi:hypothetical protein